MNILGYRLESMLLSFLENNLDYEIFLAQDSEELLNNLKGKRFDAVIIDSSGTGDMSLLELIGSCNEIQKKSLIMVISENSNLESVAGSLRAGAYDYFLKPLNNREFLNILEHALKNSKLSIEKTDYSKKTGDKLIGQSKEILEVYKTIGKVSKSLIPVLIVGEKGTGKGTVATAIHDFSSNRDNPFIKINCLSLGNELIERKLFGYEKGAFVGALFSQAGDLEKINDGTLYLGNIEALNLELQAKLLYYLQQGEFFPIGSAVPVKSSARILASTSANLEALAIEGKFIAELYLELKGYQVSIPPLRERKSDIPLVIDHYIPRVNQELRTSIKGISKPALKKLLRYNWPGNVNELKSTIRSAIAISRGPSIVLEDLPLSLTESSQVKSSTPGEQPLILKEWIKTELFTLKNELGQDYYNKIISKVEKELISQILEQTNGKKVDAAELLGITRNTLRTKMSIFEID